MSIFIFAVVFGLSLCADCFAVSLCSSVTLKVIRWKDVTKVALGFAFIQSLFLLLGWAFGGLFVGLVEKVAHIIGFLLLLYVGGSMLVEGVKGMKGGEVEVRDLNGWRNIILGGIATSIDALAVGISLSMDSMTWTDVMPLVISVFVVTALSVICGIWGGKTIGSKVGDISEIIGGLVLIFIGLNILL
ncbi:MAG: manganese efflux pump MntP family protein [Bacteroidales bacterium]|nr:manganese efflux pump MntP family protein [Bacteroidales bacterium]